MSDTRYEHTVTLDDPAKVLTERPSSAFRLEIYAQRFREDPSDFWAAYEVAKLLVYELPLPRARQVFEEVLGSAPVAWGAWDAVKRSGHWTSAIRAKAFMAWTRARSEPTA